MSNDPILNYRIGCLVNLDKALIARAAQAKAAYFSPTSAEIYELAAESLKVEPSRDGFIVWKNYLERSAETFPTLDDLKTAFDPQAVARKFEEMKKRVDNPGKTGEPMTATIAPEPAVLSEVVFSGPDADEDPFEVK